MAGAVPVSGDLVQRRLVGLTIFFVVGLSAVLQLPRVLQANLPRDGYLSRLSDYLNRGDLAFIPLVNATIAPLGADGPSEQRSFIAIARVHVHLAYPAGEAADGP